VILSLFQDKFLYFIYIFMCLLLMHLYQKWHNIWFGTLLKETCTSCFLLSKSCFQHFQSYSSTFSWFKAKFDADPAIFKCSVLYLGQNQKCIDSQLYWISHYSVIILHNQAYSNQEMTQHTRMCLHISRNSCQQQ
jgi:hypothetical protein